MQFQRPPYLKPGDKVAIVSPSSGMPHIFPWVYEQGLNRIKEVFQYELWAYRSPDHYSQRRNGVH